MTDIEKEDRFVQRYENEGLDFWGRVIFSDEKPSALQTMGNCTVGEGTPHDTIGSIYTK